MKKISNVILIFIFSLSSAIAQPGSLDRSFNKNFKFYETDKINSVAIQSDGKIIIGGVFWHSFNDYNYMLNMLRLNQNGSFDTGFKFPNHYDYDVSNILVQPDSKILVAGRNLNISFNTFNKISRLNSNNTWDLGFYPKFSAQQVNLMKSYPGNKTLIGFSESCFQDELIRINKDGKIDKSFWKGIFNGGISTFSVQGDGKILVSGFFTEYDEDICPSFIRLNGDGSLDPSFNTNKYWDNIFPNIIIPFSNGKILVAGYFGPNYHGSPIARLNENGSLDTSFKIEPIFDNQCEIKAIHVQSDGKIILGGRFLTNNWERNIVRLNSDGSLDRTFKTGEGFNFPVLFILPQSQNNIIVVGEFNRFNNEVVDRVVSLNIKDESILNVLILPNPSQGIFKISATQTLNQIIINDALGKEILRTEPNAFDSEIDLTDKAPGVYFVITLSAYGSKCQKILKN